MQNQAATTRSKTALDALIRPLVRVADSVRTGPVRTRPGRKASSRHEATVNGLETNFRDPSCECRIPNAERAIQNALALDRGITYNASVIPPLGMGWGEFKQFTKV